MAGLIGATHFSTARLPEGEREAVVRETIWRPLYGMDIEPDAETPLEFDFRLLTLPGLHCQQSRISRARLQRDRRFAAHGRDYMALVCFQDGPAGVVCGGVEVEVAAGDAFLVHGMEAARFHVPSSQFVCLDLERSALLERAELPSLPPVTVIPRTDPALVVLLRYARELLSDDVTQSSPELSRLALRHVQDLLALALNGRKADVQHKLEPGLRELRMREARQLIHEHLADPELSLDGVARSLGISRRYVQRLFEQEGSSFSREVLHQRLGRARHLLTHPLFRNWTITRIALEVGFSDLSYFNRCFRRTFHATPTEIRRLRETANESTHQSRVDGAWVQAGRDGRELPYR